MPSISGIRVIRSSIDGYGVIATRDFAPGEVIADVEGIMWREEEAVDDKYSLWIDDGVYMDMVAQTRWINHSCDPNCEIEGALGGDAGAWARILAYKPIRAGEELTYDYAFPADLAEVCRCGTENCRGYIVDPDEIDQVARSA